MPIRSVLPCSGYWMLALFACTQTCHAKAGDHHFYLNNYIEYVEGDLPFIISAPHGGGLLPVEFGNRVTDSANTVPDRNTDEMAKEMLAQIYSACSHYPYMVINHIHRQKLDPNRDSTDTLEPPYFDAAGKAAWMAYHGFIRTAKEKIELSFAKGLLIDLHGHSHALQRVELGYLITNYQLGKPDSSLMH